MRTAEHWPTLVGRARRHGATLVAERVETPEQLARCSALGLDPFEADQLQVTALDRPLRPIVPGARAAGSRRGSGTPPWGSRTRAAVTR